MRKERKKELWRGSSGVKDLRRGRSSGIRRGVGIRRARSKVKKEISSVDQKMEI